MISRTLSHPFSSAESADRNDRWFDAVFWFSFVISLSVSLFRGADINTIWIDEFYSVNMIQIPIREIIQSTSFDAHPPLYYIILKYWFHLLEWAGLEPSIFGGRSLSIISMMAGIFAARWQLIPVTGRAAANLTIAVVALMPGWFDVVDDMRNYAMVMSLVLNGGIAWMILLGTRNMRINQRRTLSLWFIYAVCMIVAWWMHLLVGMVILWFGIVWLYFVVRDSFVEKRFPFNRFTTYGILFHALILISFIPWIMVLQRQLNYIGTANLYWMTKPTVYNLFTAMMVTTFNGRDIWNIVVDHDPMLIAATTTAFFLLLAFIMNLIRCEKFPKLSNRLYLFPVLAVWAGFVYSLWILSLYDIITVFHAPRYPLIISPFVICGFGMMVFNWRPEGDRKPTDENQAEFRDHRPSRIWENSTAFAPVVAIFFVSVWTTVHVQLYKKESMLQSLHRVLAEYFPPHGSTLYITPDYQNPYLTVFKKYYNVISWSEMKSGDLEPGDDLNILAITMWIPFREQDRLEWLFLSHEPLHEENVHFQEISHPSFGIFSVKNITAEQIGYYSWPPQIPDPELPWPVYPDDAFRIFHSKDLNWKLGWGTLEIGAANNMFRWGYNGSMTIQTGPALPDGDYLWKMKGYTPPENGTDSEVKVTIGKEQSYHPLPGGSFDLIVPFTVSRGNKAKEIKLEYESTEGSGHGRPLALLYNGSWIEKAEAQNQQ